MIENEHLKHKFEEVNMELEQLQNDKQELRKEIHYIQADWQTMKDSYSDQENYIIQVEKELELLKDVIKKVYLAHPEISVIQANPLKQLEKIKKKTISEINTNTIKNLNLVLHEKVREKYVLTEIYDI